MSIGAVAGNQTRVAVNSVTSTSLIDPPENGRYDEPPKPAIVQMVDLSISNSFWPGFGDCETRPESSLIVTMLSVRSLRKGDGRSRFSPTWEHFHSPKLALRANESRLILEFGQIFSGTPA